MIVHGGRALNALLSSEFYRPTMDWDMYTKKPKKANIKMEKRLDKAAGGDFFKISKNIMFLHDGRPIYSILNRITGRYVCDFTEFPPKRNGGKPTYVIIGKIHYETLEDAKKIHRQVIADSRFDFRWQKSRDDLNRIIAFERKLRSARSFYRR